MDIDLIIRAIATMAGTGLVLGAILAVASRKLAINVNPRVEMVLEELPGSNCGACGYLGCEQAAEVIANGTHGVDLCIAGGQEVANRVAHVLGKDVVDVGPRKVAVHNCSGGCRLAKHRYEYDGVPTCTAAYALSGGPLACAHGCIGFGDCVSACPFDAMVMGSEGRPEILLDKCTGCGICISACPLGEEGLLSLLEEGAPIVVGCNSPASPKATRQVCDHGCIACKMCEKVCERDTIHVVDNLAVVDYEKCDGCGACVKKCPTKCIYSVDWGKRGDGPVLPEKVTAGCH